MPSEMKLSRGFIITIISIPAIFIIWVLISPIVMGSGSEGHCKNLKSDLMHYSVIDLKAKYGNSLNIITCEDGSVIGLCEDSHSSVFGGNMAVRISETEVVTYMGHVCGPRFLEVWFSEFSSGLKRESKPILLDDFKSFIKNKVSNGHQ
jgi:hypothetical protein